MSVHRDCGEQIEWVRREDDSGWAPPLELVGYYWTVSDSPTGAGKIATRVPCYQPHNCDPDKVLAWQEYKAKLAAVQEKNGTKPSEELPPWVVARQKERDALWEKVLPFACTVCDAQAGEYCRSMAKGPSLGTQLRNPHEPRIAAMEEEIK